MASAVEDYKKLLSDAWRLGAPSAADEEKLALKRDELRISPEEDLRLTALVKEEIHARHMESLVLLLKDDEKKTEARELLVKAGPQALPYLVRALDREDILPSLMEIFANLGEDSIEPLIQALKDRKKRRGASQVLRELSSQALPAMLGHLADEGDISGLEEALGTFSDCALDALLSILREQEQKAEEGGMRLVSLKEDKQWLRARRILIKTGSPAAERLIPLMDDELLSATASQMLKDMGHEAYDPLINALLQEKSAPRALEILKNAGSAVIPLFIEETAMNPALRDQAEQYILSCGADAVPYLAKNLKKDVEREFVLGLIRRYPEEAPPYLAPLLADTSAAPFAETLLLESGSASVEPLVKALKEKNTAGPAQVLLGKLPAREVLSAILEELKASGQKFIDSISISGTLESHARDLLKDLSKYRLFETVMEKVKLDPSRAVEGLGKIRDPFANKCFALIATMEPVDLTLLFEYLENDQLFSFLRLGLLSAGEKMIPLILGALPGSPAKKEERFIIILSDYGVAAVPLLIETLTDNITSESVTKALVAMGPAVAPVVAAALTREDLKEALKSVLKGYGAEGFRFYAPLARETALAPDIEAVVMALDESVLPELVAGLENEDTSALCTRLLKKRGSDAIKPLIESLKRGKQPAPVIDILMSAGSDAVPPLFEQFRSEKSLVGSLLKSIAGMGRKKEKAPSPVKKALIAIAARYPGPLLEIAENPGQRDMALPLIGESFLYILETREMEKKAENLSSIKNFILSHDLGVTIRKLITASREYGEGTVNEALSILE